MISCYMHVNRVNEKKTYVCLPIKLFYFCIWHSCGFLDDFSQMNNVVKLKIHFVSSDWLSHFIAVMAEHAWVCSVTLRFVVAKLI